MTIHCSLENRISLRGLNLEDLKKLAVTFGEPAYRGEQLAGWVYQKNISDIRDIKNLPKSFLHRLEQETLLSEIQHIEHTGSRDTSIKFLSKTNDGYFLETVLIRKNERNTVCLSTQLGCKMNCSFCASSKEGFVRNLKVSEIVNQLVLVKERTGEDIHNLVYMGMGEPLENFDAVMKSIEIFNSEWGFGIGSRKITVSTVGLVPGIEKFSNKKLRQVRLSISIHSPFDEVRNKIVPLNRKYPLTALIRTLKSERKKFGREYTFEYTLLKGVNDSKEDARELARIAREVGAKVNLIAYNPIQDADYERSELETMREFRHILDKQRVRNTLRISSGVDINAACGQLRLHRERELKS